MGEYQKAIEYCEKLLKIAIEIGDRNGERTAYGNLGTAYGNLGVVYLSLADYQKAIDYLEKHFKIAIETGDRGGEGTAYGNLGTAYQLLGDYEKAIEYYEKHLKIAIEISDREAEVCAYYNIGVVYVRLKQFENAVANFECSVEALNTLRSCLKSRDDWKINFRAQHDNSYAALWMSLLILRKVNEALLAAEQGRAQTLSDNLFFQYKLTASLSDATIDTKETISRLFAELSTTTIFLAIEGLKICIWFLSREKQVVFRTGRLEGDRTKEDPIRALLKSSLEKIGTEDTVRCEDRTFDEHDNECPFTMEVRGKGVRKLPLPSLDYLKSDIKDFPRNQKKKERQENLITHHHCQTNPKREVFTLRARASELAPSEAMEFLHKSKEEREFD
ncbi:PREDICTED: tetratricopeptide repeat protein 28-like [Acropora digitifera]|uniref:tetratricopeptide repeat protein 28-like n=1 Tax=Acropora digitifera TaxID=70779 RepID=UPI00077AED32|nr:PREDICTED: tetratricopeptide repeat protein 28-like [Acropora digitifera]